MDYGDWGRRAREFLRGLARLPLPMWLDCYIRPPLSGDYHLNWLRSEQCSLPPELRLFLETASARCTFGYGWQMSESARGELQGIVPAGPVIMGGGDFCEAAGYQLHDQGGGSFSMMFNEAARQALGYLAQSLFGETEADTNSSREASPVRGKLEELFAGDIFGNETRESFPTQLRRRGLVPLLMVTSPDWERRECVRGAGEAPLDDAPQHWLCLETKEFEGARRVMSVDATTQEATPINGSFDEFLLAWERACYLTPTLEMLALWSDASGRFAPRSADAGRLRNLLNSAGTDREDSTWT